MANTFNAIYKEKLQAGLQKHFEMGSMTGWMEANAKGVDYKGGKKVTMVEIATDGMGDYDRQHGYPRGNVTGSKVEYEMTKDRGREFVIDVADYDETGFLITAASVMSEFQANHVIPEVDAYRLGQIYALVAAQAAANVKDDAIDPALITDMLLEDLAIMQDANGSMPLVIMMSALTQAKFGKEFIRNLNYQDFGGSIKTKVRVVDGTPLTILPSARLKSAYTFYDGITAGQEAGGFIAAVGAKDIKWTIVPQGGPIAVAKIDKIRVFTPDEYQDMHAWKTDYRLFHDIWLPERMAKKSLIRTGVIETPAV